MVGFSPSNSSCPFGSIKVGDYHTHGFYSDLKGNPVLPQYEAYDSLHFSPQDISGIASDGIGNPDYTGFLGTPDNKYYKFTPGTGKN
ncbi:DUF4329 domain-containing protein [Salmonella enterica]|uniref:DUF4329 domain-containing protein n=1 Tax=Salmonella enterica TaxID=28901 RepID=UPI001F2D1AA9|nr:DUF4329 domain-containing protein [Salmonella enterica]